MSKSISNSSIEVYNCLNNNYQESNIKLYMNKEYYIKNIKIIIKKKIHFIHNHLKRYFYLFYFIFSYFLFYLSLEKCLDGTAECCRKEFWIKMKITEEIISCLIISLLIELIFYKIISKFHLIHFFIVFLYFYKYSHGMDFDDHGYFNIVGLFIIVTIILFLFIPINIFIYLKKRNNRKLIYFCLFSLVTIIYIGYQISKNFLSNCYDWPKGLNDTYIYNNNSIYGCQIIFPKQCPYKVGKYFLDITKIKGIKCENNNINGFQIFSLLSSSPYLNKRFNRIGFPLTNKDTMCFLDCIDNKNDNIKKYFFQNLVDMDNKIILETIFKDKKPEIEIDFTNNTGGEMIINLDYNKTLSKERKKKEYNSKPYSNNIMILYIDSVSRVNSIRQLKKTLKFVEKFISYKGGLNKKYPSENFHSFQFFKYHSFMAYTQGNYPILYYGRTSDEKMVLITKYLKENGYITCYVNDLCSKENIRTNHNFTREEVYDHQFLLCDPNAKHYNSNSIRCLYGKKISHFLYEYGNQFWRKYKNNRKFLNIITNDGHEGTLELVKYIDDIIYNFLNNLFNDNLLKESTIFLLSDHGVGMPSIYYLFNFYKIEICLPMLYMIINDRKNISYENQYKFLFENQQTFITAYDIYNTIGNIIYGDKYFFIENKTSEKDSPKSREGKSLFTEINKKERYPDLYSNMTYNFCK